MKKIAIFILCALTALSICACGRNDTEQTQATTTVPNTENDIIPDIVPGITDPTMETNIPDPNVDTSMPDMTDGAGTTDATNSTNGAKSRSGMFG